MVSGFRIQNKKVSDCGWSEPCSVWQQTTAASRLEKGERVRIEVGWSLPSEEGTTRKGLRIFNCNPRPESGLDCLLRAVFALDSGGLLLSSSLLLSSLELSDTPIYEP